MNVLLIAIACWAGQTEWPGYKGNGGLTGLSADASIRPPFALRWTYRLDGDASSDAGAGVTVAAGKVFVNVHNTRSIVALDATTGRFAWEFREQAIGYMTAPTYADGRLYLWLRQHKRAAVVVLDANTGMQVAEFPLSIAGLDRHRAGLPVVGGRVVCSEGGDEPAVFALDAKSGAEVWRTPLGREDGTDVGCPVAAEGRVFVATRETHLWKKSAVSATIALDAATGKLLWRRRGVFARGAFSCDAEVVACGMYLSESERFHLLDARTGETRWEAPRRFHYAPATLTPNLVLIKPYGSDFIAVDRQTGRQQWEFRGRCTSGCGSPVVAGDFAFLGTGVIAPGDLESPLAFQHGHRKESPRERGVTGTLHAIDLKTGQSVWRFGTGNTICGEPALAYGRLYFASRDGCVYCFAPAQADEPTTPEAKDTSPPAAPDDVAALLAQPDRSAERGWPMLGGSPTRAGRDLPTLRLPLAEAWTFDAGDRIVGAAAIREGRVVFGSDAGKLHALDLATGQRRWDVSLGGAIRCSPAVAEDLAYCGSDRGEFHALDLATGAKRWSFAAGGPVRGSPVVVGGVVLFGANDHHLYALDRRTGRKLWSFRAGDYCVQVPPVVQGDRVFCGQWTERVYALDAKSGRELWQSYVPVSVESLAVHRDSLWVRNVHYVVELDPASGERRRLGDASWGWGGMAFRQNKLFVSGIQSQYGTSGATVTDLDDPGQPIEKAPTLESVRRLRGKSLLGREELASMGTPLVVGEHLVFASVRGKLSLTAPDGKVLWSTKLGASCHATPVAADGFLVVGDDAGRMHAFREP